MAGEKSKTKAAGNIHTVRRIAQKITIYPGAAPGMLKPVSGSAMPVIRHMHTGGGAPYAVQDIADLAALPQAASKGVNWVRVTGMGDVEPLRAVTDFYGIRKMALEDVLSPGWRTKVEQYGEYAFFVLQAPTDMASGQKKGDHLTLFCKPGLIISFEDGPASVIDLLWERLKEEPLSAKIAHPAEFLTYMVLDVVVDRFFPHLDKTDEALAALEDRLSAHTPGRAELNTLHTIKRDLITQRRLLTPFRELRTELARQHPPAQFVELAPFFNDLGDHILQANELLETYYEVARSLDDISQTALTNRMNDIVRMLTIISTIFMPLSFIAGVYGMNFNTESRWNMPELGFAYGYPLTLGGMAVIVILMLWYFRRKRWFD